MGDSFLDGEWDRKVEELWKVGRDEETIYLVLRTTSNSQDFFDGEGTGVTMRHVPT